MIILQEQHLREAIREGLAEAGVYDDDAGYFETAIMRRVGESRVRLGATDVSIHCPYLQMCPLPEKPCVVKEIAK